MRRGLRRTVLYFSTLPAHPAGHLAIPFCFELMNSLPYFVTLGDIGAFLISERARFTGDLYPLAQAVYNSRGEILLCLSDHVTESLASPIGTCSSLSVQQDEQHPAHQMVICSTSHLCCIPDSLQPRTVSSIHAARQLLPTTLPNGSSQSHGLPRQTGSSICSSFWQGDGSLSGSSSWLHQSLFARRMI